MRNRTSSIFLDCGRQRPTRRPRAATRDAIVREQAARMGREAALEAKPSLCKSDPAVGRTARGDPGRVHASEALDNAPRGGDHARSGICGGECAHLFGRRGETGRTPPFVEGCPASDPGQQAQAVQAPRAAPQPSTPPPACAKGHSAPRSASSRAPSRCTPRSTGRRWKRSPAAKAISEAIAGRRNGSNVAPSGSHCALLVGGARNPHRRQGAKRIGGGVFGQERDLDQRAGRSQQAQKHLRSGRARLGIARCVERR